MTFSYKRVPSQVVIAAFTSEEAADECLQGIAKNYCSNGNSTYPICSNAIIATKDEEGQTKVKELGKPDFLKGLLAGGAVGAASGAVLGGATLALLGPLGIMVGATAGGLMGTTFGATSGAAAGTVAKMTIKSMTKEEEESLNESLEPGTSALILVFSEVLVRTDVYEQKMEEAEATADAVSSIIADNITKNLKEGNNYAHLLAIDEQGVVGMTAVTGDDVLKELSGLVLTDDGVAAAGFAADDSNAAAAAVVATEDGIFAGGKLVGQDKDDDSVTTTEYVLEVAAMAQFLSEAGFAADNDKGETSGGASGAFTAKEDTVFADDDTEDMTVEPLEDSFEEVAIPSSEV